MNALLSKWGWKSGVLVAATVLMLGSVDESFAQRGGNGRGGNSGGDRNRGGQVDRGRGHGNHRDHRDRRDNRGGADRRGGHHDHHHGHWPGPIVRPRPFPKPIVRPPYWGRPGRPIYKPWRPYPVRPVVPVPHHWIHRRFNTLSGAQLFARSLRLPSVQVKVYRTGSVFHVEYWRS